MHIKLKSWAIIPEAELEDVGKVVDEGGLQRLRLAPLRLQVVLKKQTQLIRFNYRVTHLLGKNLLLAVDLDLGCSILPGQLWEPSQREVFTKQMCHPVEGERVACH